MSDKLKIQDKEIDIVALNFPDSVRLRPGKLIGSTETPDVILREIIDNAKDEAFGSLKCDKIWINLKNGQKGGYYLVADNGRGIPIIWDDEHQMTKCELAVATLDAGSKFHKDLDAISTGSNGVGGSCFQYDTEVIVKVDKDKNVLSIKIGDLVNEFKKNHNLSVLLSDGTFSPISDVFETKKVNSLLELELDNGTKIKCTPDHRFLLKDGSYKCASDLTEEDDIEESTIKVNLKELLSNKSINVTGPLVYRIHNLLNDKSYVGATSISLYSRFVGGKCNVTHGYCIGDGMADTPLYNDVRSMGSSNFEVEILFIGDVEKSELNRLEKFYIDKFKSYTDGYNISADGLGGFSREVLVEMRKKCKEKGAGFYNSELQSELGSRGAAVRVRNMRDRGILFFDKEFEEKMSHKSVGISISKTYDAIISNNLEVNELNWSKFKTINTVTFRNIHELLDDLISEGYLPEESRGCFVESNFNFSSRELREMHYPEYNSNPKYYTTLSTFFYRLYEDTSHICSEDWDCMRLGMVPNSDIVLSMKDMLINCNYVPKEFIDELASGDNSKSVLSKWRKVIPDADEYLYKSINKSIRFMRSLRDKGLEITEDNWESERYTYCRDFESSKYYINLLIEGGLLDENLI